MNPNVKEITERELKRDPSIICGFCSRNKINTLEWGTMYKLGSIYTHYFCLLFSANLSQGGEDDEGILGFLAKDIKKEFNRGAKLKCSYCKLQRATVGCSVKTCKKSFHYTCGYENSCNFQFVGKFESYCPLHKPRVDIPIQNPDDWICPICFCIVEGHENPISPPCCRKAVFHRKCVMTMATTHGYFFKCPLCNDKKNFERDMQLAGVYVPQMDAAWERDPNAFADQSTQYSNCDADDCLCPKGRKHHEKETKWNLSRCGGCGSSAMHKECGQLPTFSYKCPTCQTVLAGTGILSSQSSEESDTGNEHSSQTTVPSTSRTARISRPTFYDDEDYKSSSEDDEPVENVVEIIQCAPNVQEMEENIETPPVPRQFPKMLRFNHMMIDPNKNLVYDGLHQKKYKVEGGKGIINNKNDDSKVCNKRDDPRETTNSNSNEDRNIESSCSVREISDAVIVAADINSLRDANFQEKIAQLKNFCQKIMKNKTSMDENEVQTSENDINVEERDSQLKSKKSVLDFVTNPKIVPRRLDFDAKNAALPPIQVQNQSLNFGPETTLLDVAKNLSPSQYSNGSPEQSRSSPIGSEETVSSQNTANRKIENQIQNEKVGICKPIVNKPANKDNIEIIDLGDDDDDIQVCDYIAAKPLKILSVTSLNPEPYVPKSQAFLNMLNRFKEFQNPCRPYSSISKENSFGPKLTSDIIEEVILSESDDDLEVVEVIQPLKQQITDDIGFQGSNINIDKACTSSSTGKTTRDSSLLENNNSKRPRLSLD